MMEAVIAALAGLTFLIVLIFIIVYNRLVSMRNKVREAFSAIDVYLEQRFDALVKQAETVASYAEHERDTLTKIAEMRSGLNRLNDDEKIRAYNEADHLMRGMNVQVENYPDLKASTNYMHLQKTINDLEEKLSASRRTYNARVNLFNTAIQQFPTNLFAGMMKFTDKPLITIDEAKRQDVDMRSLLRR